MFQLTLSEDATQAERPVIDESIVAEKPAPVTTTDPAKSKRKRTKKPKVDEKTGRRPISFG